jgi:hypothetical protein
MNKHLLQALLLSSVAICLPTMADEEIKKEDSTLPDIEVKAHPSLSYDDLTKKMSPPQTPEMLARNNSQMGSEAIINRPSNQLGLFNYATTSIRMGNAFGVSTTPQRPPRPQAPTPFGPR